MTNGAYALISAFIVPISSFPMFLPDLTHRRREEEWMDAPDADPAELQRSLKFIRRVNALFGYTRQTISHLERFSKRWQSGERITIVDFATGSADVPRAILRWAGRRGFDVRVVGLDLHQATAAIALASEKDPRLEVICASAMAAPFESGSFDYAITSMFLHHLDEDQVVNVLGEMNRIGRRGIIASDLLRDRRAYGWISLFTLAAGPMVRHDARVSVGQAFVEAEVLTLRDRAGVGFADFHRHFGHRFVLAGERA
jgi:2-polyprenyl-3-methyl-5-hydroxy-6-metoxy-1,4-benzoquinol methylase